MKIAPIMISTNNSVSNKGQGNSSFKSYNAYQKIGTDVYSRLAYASTKDARIEHELKSMNLIV